MIDISSRPTLYQGVKTTQGESQWSLKHFIIFLVLGAGIAVLTSRLLNEVFLSPGLLPGLKVLLGLAGLLFVMIFQSLVVRDLQFNIWLGVAEGAALLSFIYGQLSFWSVVGVFFFILFSAIGFWLGQDDINNHLKISFRRFSKIVLSHATIGLAIFLSLLCVGAYQASGTVSPKVFEGFVSGSVPAVRSFLPEFKLEMTLDKFLDQVVNQSLSGRAELALLTVEARAQLFAELVNSLKERVVKFTGVSPERSDTFLGYAYRSFSALLISIKEKGFGEMLIVGMIFILFFFFRGLFYIIKWPLIYISYFVYGVLLSMGIIYVLVEPRNKEVVLVK